MNLRRIAWIFFIACLAGSFVCAQSARPNIGQPDEVVELQLSSDIATWDINVANDGVSLRVIGPRDFVYQATYAAGDPVFFDFVDESGAALTDGLYNWEVVVTPSGSLRTRSEVREAVRQEMPAYSGAFRIESGLAVSPDLQEGALRARDIIHNDDVIARFSMCIGTDCVNGESFGFDTLRLKENNLRMHFDDTSSTASFPNQEWRLIANDSANGGGEYFSIEDATAARRIFTVEANGPTHSLYVDDGGRVGLGTSTPVVELHVVDGDTPTLRLEQNGSSGFTPQTWDVAGNETNFFIRDATNGSPLPFRIQPSAPQNTLFLDSEGDVGVNTASPGNELCLHDSEDSGSNVELGFALAAQDSWVIRANNTNGQLNIINDTDGTTPFRIGMDGVTNLLQVGVSANDTVDIDGNLVITGMCTGCDGVFEPSFKLSTIEDHAKQMWANSYLPGVGPTPDGTTTLNVFEKMTGILQELEVAHIYIEQLNNTVKELQERIGELESDKQ